MYLVTYLASYRPINTVFRQLKLFIVYDMIKCGIIQVL